VAEHREALELERLGESVDVGAELRERELLSRNTVAAPVPALVVEDEPELVRERLEVRNPRRVVAAGTAVDEHEREAVADLVDVEGDAVCEHDVHGKSGGGNVI
jgi:hypothetical protein